MTWQDLEQVFRLAVVAMAYEWKCRLPPYNQVLSIDDEAACDVWCRRIAQRMMDPVNAPLHLRPWILARFAAAGACSKLLSSTGEPVPSLELRDLLEYMVVRLWHEDLRTRWRELADDCRIEPN